jgi:cell wall-associated NlpC family hydrolase
MAPVGYRHPPRIRCRDRALAGAAIFSGCVFGLVALIVLVGAWLSAPAKGSSARVERPATLAAGAAESGNPTDWSSGGVVGSGGPVGSGVAGSVGASGVGGQPAAPGSAGWVSVTPELADRSDPAALPPVPAQRAAVVGAEVTLAPAVCTRMVPDLDSLHTALLTATGDEVFCLRGADHKPMAISAVAFARAALGTPYVWGGNGKRDGGFDCSGLTTAAYAAAGLRLPRTAQTQYNAMPHLPADAQVQPGDLVFFGAGPRSVTHVGIAVSETEMINAPQPGERVKVAPLRRRDLVGIARPSELRGASVRGSGSSD